MPVRARDAFFRELAGGLYEPTDKRVRVVLGGRTIVDTTRAVLVWEPAGSFRPTPFPSTRSTPNW